MKIAANKLNNEGLVLSKSKLREEFITALAKYNKLNIYLFNECILDSPSFVDWIKIKRFLLEEHPDFYSKLKNDLDGSIEFTSKRMFYILRNGSDDDILMVIYRLLALEEQIASINSIYDGVKFKKSADTIVYKPSYIITSKIVNRSKVDALRSVLLNCIAGEDKVLVSCESFKVICEYLCKKYGVEYQYGTSIFMRDESDLVDRTFISEFLTGKIKGNTSLAKKLFKDITTYYHNHSVDYTTENSSCMDFDEHIFNDCLDDLVALQKKFREENPDCIPFALDDYSVFYYKEGVSVPNSLPYNLFGLDCIDYYTGETLNIRNSLCGLCGEYIAEADIARNKLQVVGMPLDLYISDTKTMKYYPLVNVRNEKGNFLEPNLNNDLYYVPEEYTPIEEVDEVDSILNTFLSWKNNFTGLDNFVSIRLKFSDTEILDKSVSRLKNLGVL